MKKKQAMSGYIDPVATKLGRNVAQIIYLFVHQSMICEINAEYFRRMLRVREDGAPVFRLESGESGQFCFNYRALGLGKFWCYIYTWDNKGRHFGQLQSLPLNY